MLYAQLCMLTNTSITYSCNRSVYWINLASYLFSDMYIHCCCS